MNSTRSLALLAALALVSCSSPENKARSLAADLEPRIARGEVDLSAFDNAVAEAGFTLNEAAAVSHIFQRARVCLSIAQQLRDHAENSRTSAGSRVHLEQNPPSLSFSWGRGTPPAPTPLGDLRASATTIVEKLPAQIDELVRALRALAETEANPCVSQLIDTQIAAYYDEHTTAAADLSPLIAATDRTAVESGHRNAKILTYYLDDFTEDINRLRRLAAQRQSSSLTDDERREQLEQEAQQRHEQMEQRRREDAEKREQAHIAAAARAEEIRPQAVAAVEAAAARRDELLNILRTLAEAQHSFGERRLVEHEIANQERSANRRLTQIRALLNDRDNLGSIEAALSEANVMADGLQPTIDNANARLSSLQRSGVPEAAVSTPGSAPSRQEASPADAPPISAAAAAPEPPTIDEIRAEATTAMNELEALHDELIRILEARIAAAAGDPAATNSATNALTLAQLAKRQDMDRLRGDVAANAQWRLEGAISHAAIVRDQLQAQIADLQR